MKITKLNTTPFYDLHDGYHCLDGLRFPTWHSQRFQKDELMAETYIEDGGKAGIFVGVRLPEAMKTWSPHFPRDVDIEILCTPDFLEANEIPLQVSYPASEGIILDCDAWPSWDNVDWTGHHDIDVRLFRDRIAPMVMRLTAAIAASEDLTHPHSQLQTGEVSFADLHGGIQILGGLQIDFSREEMTAEVIHQSQPGHVPYIHLGLPQINDYFRDVCIYATPDWEEYDTIAFAVEAEHGYIRALGETVAVQWTGNKEDDIAAYADCVAAFMRRYIAAWDVYLKSGLPMNTVTFRHWQGDLCVLSREGADGFDDYTIVEGHRKGQVVAMDRNGKWMVQA